MNIPATRLAVSADEARLQPAEPRTRPAGTELPTRRPTPHPRPPGREQAAPAAPGRVHEPGGDGAAQGARPAARRRVCSRTRSSRARSARAARQLRNAAVQRRNGEPARGARFPLPVSGGGEIRTLGGPMGPQRFSRPPRSTAPAPLHEKAVTNLSDAPAAPTGTTPEARGHPGRDRGGLARDLVFHARDRGGRGHLLL